MNLFSGASIGVGGLRRKGRIDRLRLTHFRLLQRLELGCGGVERDVVAVGCEGAVAQRGRALSRICRALGGFARFRFQRGALLGGEEAVYALGELRVESFHLRDLLGSRGADPPERSEMRQQRALPLFADARDLFQDAAEIALPAQLAAVGDGEAMRLVAQPRQEEQLVGILPQDDRILLPWQEDALRAALHLALDESSPAPGPPCPAARSPRLGA